LKPRATLRLKPRPIAKPEAKATPKPENRAPRKPQEIEPKLGGSSIASQAEAPAEPEAKDRPKVVAETAPKEPIDTDAKNWPVPCPLSAWLWATERTTAYPFDEGT
jgi:hypothetical protein